jgi:hypothetical protein
LLSFAIFYTFLPQSWGWHAAKLGVACRKVGGGMPQGSTRKSPNYFNDFNRLKAVQLGFSANDATAMI